MDAVGGLMSLFYSPRMGSHTFFNFKDHIATTLLQVSKVLADIQRIYYLNHGVYYI